MRDRGSTVPIGNKSRLLLVDQEPCISGSSCRNLAGPLPDSTCNDLHSCKSLSGPSSLHREKHFFPLPSISIFCDFQGTTCFHLPFYLSPKKVNCTSRSPLETNQKSKEENSKIHCAHLKCGQSEVAGEQSRERSLPLDEDDEILRQAALVTRSYKHSI